MTLVNEKRYNRFARWSSTTAKLLGAVELIFALVLLIPSVIAVYLGEDFMPFLFPVPILAILGLAQFMLFSESKNFRSINGLLLVGIAWLVVFFISLIPFVLSGFTFIDALFESVSGLTTTGCTVIADIESWPMSLLVWRSMTQWIGGVAVIIIFMYLLPLFGMGRTFFYNELAGSGSSDYSVKMRKAAKSFILVYGILSLINLVLLLICGMDFFEAMCLMFSTISTGGLMCTNQSLMVYSDAIQIVTILFMFLGGTNFYLHYRGLYKHNRRTYRENSEFRVMTLWFVVISVIIYLAVMSEIISTTSMSLYDHFEVFKNALFTTVSLGTTTGFYVYDYTVYPTLCVMLLMLVAFIGASAGSTSGGVKFGRLRIVYEFIKDAFVKTLHPNAVTSVKVDKQNVDESTVMSALTVFMMYVISMIVGAVIIMAMGVDFEDSFGLSISAISNGGLGFGNYGPTGTYAVLSAPVKLTLTAMMWIGRLEVLVALVMFTPGFWKELWANHRSNKRMKQTR